MSKEKRVIRQNFRFSKSELDELEKKCDDLKITKTDFISSLIFDTKIKKNTSKDNLKYLNAINRIGNNLNQGIRILHTKNMQDELSDEDYSKLLNKLIIIENQLNAIYEEVSE